MEITQCLRTPAFTEFCCFTRDGSLMASCHYDEVVAWDTSDLSRPHTLAFLQHAQTTWKCCFTSDGMRLCSACSDGHLYIWSSGDWNLHSKIAVTQGCLYSVAAHPTRPIVAACGSEGIIKILNTDINDDSACLCTLEGHVNSVEDVAFSPCGNLLASASKDYTLRLWYNMDKLTADSKPGHVTKANPGHMIKTNPGHMIKTKPSHVILGWHNGWVLSVQFSPDGKMVASTSTDKTARLWSVEKLFLLRTLRGHINIVWRSQWVQLGRKRKFLLATVSSDRMVRLWNPSTGKAVHQLQDLCDHGNHGDGQLLCCSVHPGLPLLAVGTYHTRIYLVRLDIEKLKELMRTPASILLSPPKTANPLLRKKPGEVEEGEKRFSAVITNGSNGATTTAFEEPWNHRWTKFRPPSLKDSTKGNTNINHS